MDDLPCPRDTIYMPWVAMGCLRGEVNVSRVAFGRADGLRGRGGSPVSYTTLFEDRSLIMAPTARMEI